MIAWVAVAAVRAGPRLHRVENLVPRPFEDNVLELGFARATSHIFGKRARRKERNKIQSEVA